MKLRPSILFLLLIALLACKKESKEKVVPPPDNFQPVSAYSVWTYSEFPASGLYSITMTGLDTTFDKKKYKEVFSTLSGYYYFRKDAGSYYLLFPSDTTQEYLYLKDIGFVGDHWEDSYDINGFPTRFYYSILEFNQPRLVNGSMYQDVITVKRDTYVDFGTGTDSLMFTENYSYANNVGLILIDKGIDKVYLSHYQIH